MATYLMVQGIDPVELDENYNLVRHRLNRARKNIVDYEAGNIDGVTKADKEKSVESQIFEPFHILSFRTIQRDENDELMDEPGRFSVNFDRIIGVGSDEARDGGSADED